MRQLGPTLDAFLYENHGATCFIRAGGARTKIKRGPRRGERAGWCNLSFPISLVEPGNNCGEGSDCLF